MAVIADLSAVTSSAVSKVTLLRYLIRDELVLLSDCPPPGPTAPGRPVASVISRTIRRRSDGDQVADEDQGLTGGDDVAGAAVAVGQVRRDHELAAATDPHVEQWKQLTRALLL